ncbi:MAG: S9 family peptidase, partial [Bacteroidota bacterium]
MKHIFFLITMCTCIACSQRQEINEAEKVPAKYTIEQFMDIIDITGSSFSHDESKILFSSRETGIFN